MIYMLQQLIDFGQLSGPPSSGVSILHFRATFMCVLLQFFFRSFVRAFAVSSFHFLYRRGIFTTANPLLSHILLACRYLNFIFCLAVRGRNVRANALLLVCRGRTSRLLPTPPSPPPTDRPITHQTTTARVEVNSTPKRFHSSAVCDFFFFSSSNSLCL